MSQKIHLFFPENDLALAANNPNYTPPDAASALHRAGEALPIWYGEPGDMFLTSGIYNKWLTEIEKLFNPGIMPFDHSNHSLKPTPWGWSKASRRYFSNAGFDAGRLPDDNSLERIRQLSHRRTSSQITSALQALLPFTIAPAASELHSESEITDYIKLHGPTMLKSPWSSSGRGLIPVGSGSPHALITQACGVIRRQGSIMAEPYYSSKYADFAMLFEMNANGSCSFSGLSLFNTNAKGGYTGNIIASESRIEQLLSAYYPLDNLRLIKNSLPPILEQTIGTAYSGLLGIDMMIVSDNAEEPTALLAACVEINLRATMGHVANRFHKRFCAENITGLFTVTPSAGNPEPHEPLIKDGKLTGGTLNLVPPGQHFNFRIEIT